MERVETWDGASMADSPSPAFLACHAKTVALKHAYVRPHSHAAHKRLHVVGHRAFPVRMPPAVPPARSRSSARDLRFAISPPHAQHDPETTDPST